ncbi:MAG TPA: DUF3426 domain-containing protein [Desulfuromonadaceae bacterium]
MIIQCEQCSTKFRLDDSRVTDKGVKVRCAKCRHVFTVTKEPVETEAQPDLDAMFSQQQPDFGAMLDQHTALGSEEPAAPPEVPAADAGFDYSDFVSHDFAEQGVSPEGGGFEPPAEEAAPAASPADAFDFSLESEQGGGTEQRTTEAVAGEFDFGGFDFGAGTAEPEKTAATEPAGFDFGDITMDQPPAAAPAGGTADAGAVDFGQISTEVPPAPETAAFDFGDDIGFGGTPSAPSAGEAAEFGFDSAAAGAAVGETQPSVAEPAAEETFNLGEFDFGDEPAAQPAAQEVAPAPAPPVEMPGEQPGHPQEPEGGEAGEELPPLSITSRRKQSPLFGILIAVVTVVVVAVLGFFGYTTFLEDKSKVVTEAGRITVRAVNAAFVNNPAIGDLLVITGEAVNNFPKPRAAIQVKGMVYGAGGQVLASKNAYCGNPLTPAQLSTLSLDKIEAAMANQFGDSLTNMEVAPGRAIPFVIVIPKPPAEGKDYGVEPAGSTVAAGKQQ